MEACFHEDLCLYLYCATHRQRDEAKRNRAGAAHASGDSTDVKMAALRMITPFLLCEECSGWFTWCIDNNI